MLSILPRVFTILPAVKSDTIDQESFEWKLSHYCLPARYGNEIY